MNLVWKSVSCLFCGVGSKAIHCVVWTGSQWLVKLQNRKEYKTCLLFSNCSYDQLVQVELGPGWSRSIAFCFLGWASNSLAVPQLGNVFWSVGRRPKVVWRPIVLVRNWRERYLCISPSCFYLCQSECSSKVGSYWRKYKFFPLWYFLLWLTGRSSWC